jgi:hypothetical protein
MAKKPMFTGRKFLLTRRIYSLNSGKLQKSSLKSEERNEKESTNVGRVCGKEELV